MSRHFLILGETGSGKTRSGILPIVNAALDYGVRFPNAAPAMLVIDPKFELTPFLRKRLGDFADRLIVLDPNAPSGRFRLLEGMAGLDASSVVDYTLRNCSPSYGASNSVSDPFWRDSARAIIDCFVAADMERRNTNEQLWKDLYRAADTDSRSLWNHCGITPQSAAWNYYENAYRLLAGTIGTEKYDALTAFTKSCQRLGVPKHAVLFLESLVSSPQNQRGSQVSQTMLYLRELTNPVLNRVVDLRPTSDIPEPHEALSIATSLDTGTVLAYQPSSCSEIDNIIGRALKTKFFEACFTRRQKQRPVFYVCDEFHRFITSDPESGEQSFLDRCRAYRVTCALATQSIASLRFGLAARSTGSFGHLDSALGIILGNTGNKLIFRNTDPDTQSRLMQMIPRSPGRGDLHVLEAHPLASLSAGACYFSLADGRVGRAQITLRSLERSATAVTPFRVRLARALTVDEILAACDQVEWRMQYYWENAFEIEIDSPGGEVPALDYFLKRMDRWRLGGARTATLGLLQVCSAAADVLSMGDIGQRRALRECRVLFHDSRVLTSSSMPITRQRAMELAHRLDSVDAVRAERLAKHLFGPAGLAEAARDIDFDDPRLQGLNLGFSGVVRLDESRFVEMYRALSSRDEFITANQALLLKLIDEILD